MIAIKMLQVISALINCSNFNAVAGNCEKEKYSLTCLSKLQCIYIYLHTKAHSLQKTIKAEVH